MIDNLSSHTVHLSHYCSLIHHALNTDDDDDDDDDDDTITCLQIFPTYT